MKASSFPGSDLLNMLGLLGLTWDFGSMGARGAGGAGGRGMESAARQSVMAWSVSINWVWYW